MYIMNFGENYDPKLMEEVYMHIRIFMYAYLYIYVHCTYIYILVNSCLQRDFLGPPGAWRPRRHLWAPLAPPLGCLRRPFDKPTPSAAVKDNMK